MLVINVLNSFVLTERQFKAGVNQHLMSGGDLGAIHLPVLHLYLSVQRMPVAISLLYMPQRNENFKTRLIITQKEKRYRAEGDRNYEVSTWTVTSNQAWPEPEQAAPPSLHKEKY